MKDAMQALTELREIVESKDANSAANQEKLEKLESALDAHEQKNAELTAQVNEERKSADELKTRMEELETKMSRGSTGADEEKVALELKAFEKLAQKGAAALTADEMKYLRTDVDVDGGYLAPNEYVNEIIKDLTDISPMRQVSRIRRTSRGEIEIPKRTALLQGGWRGEGGQINSDNSKYGMIKIPTHHLDVIVPITNTMLTDAAFNMESEINSDVVESFDQLEGAAFVNGDGINKPEGVMQNADIAEINSGIANDLSADNFFDLQGELKRGYQGTFAMTRKTLARVRKLKDSQGAYLFAPAAAGMPATIAGENYVLMQDMDEIGANANPVAYGDWMRGYTIVDSLAMTMLRDPYTLADTGKVRFVFGRRTGGKVVQAEALKKLKCSV